MSVRLGLLAILDQGSCYGYQLRTELDRRTGGTGPVNVGQIYNTLDRLEKSGHVRKAGVDAEAANYYTITEAGRAAVRDWFGTASGWDDLPAKLALAMTLPGVDVAAIIRVQRGAAEKGRPTLPADGESHDADPLTNEPVSQTAAEGVPLAVIEAAEDESVAAELRFLERVEGLLARGIAPIPLRTELPRRGRPRKTPQP